MKSKIDFSGRIGLRAVLAGVMVSISFMMISFSLIAAFGVWNYNLNELVSAGAIFWISVTVAWAISLFLAGFVAAIAARSENVLEGILNSLAASCGSYLLFGFSFLLFAPGPLEIILSSATPQFFLRAFVGDFVAFLVGVYGGVVAVHYEQRSVGFYKTKRDIASY